MMQKKVDFIWFGLSVGSFFLMSISFLLMPLDVTVVQYDAMDIIPGIIFWVFLVLGVTGQIILAIRRSKWLIGKAVRKYKIRKGRIGLLTFCKNKPALITDIVMIVSILLFIIVTVITHGLGYICYILLALCVFTFCMHCIFNGKIYEYISKHLIKEEELHVES